jgi:hypothetical protein
MAKKTQVRSFWDELDETSIRDVGGDDVLDKQGQIRSDAPPKRMEEIRLMVAARFKPKETDQWLFGPVRERHMALNKSFKREYISYCPTSDPGHVHMVLVLPFSIVCVGDSVDGQAGLTQRDLEAALLDAKNNRVRGSGVHGTKWHDPWFSWGGVRVPDDLIAQGVTMTITQAKIYGSLFEPAHHKLLDAYVSMLINKPPPDTRTKAERKAVAEGKNGKEAPKGTVVKSTGELWNQGRPFLSREDCTKIQDWAYTRIKMLRSELLKWQGRPGERGRERGLIPGGAF